MKYFSEPFRVKYSDTDQMGYMHHSNYLRFFENARISWLRDLGVSYKNMEKDGILMPVVASSLKHIKPAFFDDQLYIQIILERLPKASLEFSYVVLNQNEDTICRGYTKLAFLKSNSQKPIRCPDFIYKLFDK
ncbi:MAG: thioesterase [Flavobacteriaceae bacterium]|nr:thioesterase [Flavobacteriaceae bacterium]|tara:strand:+ start:81 stop:479 length:399 start_codon:yes stop_codon:yes gene_type:complete